MADSTYVQILDALKARAAVDFSANPWTSGENMTNRVAIGITYKPPESPWVCLTFLDDNTERGSSLTSFTVDTVYKILVFASEDDQEARVRKILNLLSDIKRSIMLEPFLIDLANCGAYPVNCRIAMISGDKYGQSNKAIGLIEVTPTFKTDTSV